jgi:aerobic-type carbon monoxide dehydrogenase small subunit (CoxS/CutS family)
MAKLVVNGQPQAVDVEDEMPLLWALRDALGLTGTKYGCGLGQCGACTVLVDHEPVFSCLTPIAVLEGRYIRTIEGLGSPDKPGVVQRAFIQEQAAQCGYCIPGMMMRAQGLLEHNASPSDAEIRDYMAPNLCRCGTQMRILRAVKRAARAMTAELEPFREATK